ncbi:dnaJ homolog subfamily C member 10 [Patella vulgata]|uniref:dnaJ homolog subfamily C member 10 n=1 Tax=Patella vulgata TaxID=6465 RepID=UPI00217F8201|nr:dnaJ homolog subfamily C member 10 [Patella vulgata]
MKIQIISSMKSSWNKARVHFLCCLLFLNLVLAEDFYQLLAISRSASTKEIRKAFKKLAITMHPDKNQDDAKAHEKFIRINRAYEVLKDDKLRKKYDMHGEEGLKDDFQRGRHYESWQWYQENFGIYDDDPEIITLNKEDFEQSVEGTDDIWFINYYSPQCSHCHQLAPDWRALAKEVEGVIRIGAINCADDWQLCQMQGIRSYPSLVLYPEREKYFGDRSVHTLVKYVMKHVKVRHNELWSGNFNYLVNGESDEVESDLPWLISFCGEGGDCLESMTCLKLASMLHELVNVGYVDCYSSGDICENLDVEYGIYFYEAGEVKKHKGTEISSLVAQEIAQIVLSQLPDVNSLDEKTLQSILTNKNTGQDEHWLVQFTDTDESSGLELRKLPAMLREFYIGRVNCKVLSELCETLHFNKFPTILVFKQNGGYETLYGRMTAHDIAAFARDSASTPMENLGPSDFPQRVVDSRDPWFVDFFAPWCPPCMRLLPEFKKAARDYGDNVNFGTVDCTIHDKLCSTYNIRSYPTTIFYNQSKPIQYKGHHHAEAMVEFLQDTMNPPVIILNKESFNRLVKNKQSDEIWLVDFYAPWCGPCMQLAPEWRRLAKMLKSTKGVHVAEVDCQENSDVCRQESINSYPTMRLFPMGTTNTAKFHMYNGWHRDATSLRAWVYEYLPSKVATLSRNSFYERILKSAEPWIVDFYAPWCGHCQTFKPEFEKVAESLDGIARAGKVDCQQYQHLCNEASITGYPTVRFYKGSTNNQQQHPSGRDIDSQDAETIIEFVRNNRRRRKDEL